MYLIASNITTRVPEIERIFRRASGSGWDFNGGPAAELKQLAKRCADAGANAMEINLQQYFDQPEAMAFAVNAVQKAVALPLCLSTNKAETLYAGVQSNKGPCLFNYISADEYRLQEMLPVVARHKTGVIILAGDPSAQTDAREMLKKTAVLVGAVNEAGITSDKIYADPGLTHLSGDNGQSHLVQALEFIRALADATDPPVKSTCWLSNSSAGIPRRLKTVVEAALLPLLVGAGLDCVFMDVLTPENKRTIRLMKIFQNEIVYADGIVGV